MIDDAMDARLALMSLFCQSITDDSAREHLERYDVVVRPASDSDYGERTRAHRCGLTRLPRARRDTDSIGSVRDSFRLSEGDV